MATPRGKIDWEKYLPEILNMREQRRFRDQILGVPASVSTIFTTTSTSTTKEPEPFSFKKLEEVLVEFEEKPRRWGTEDMKIRILKERPDVHIRPFPMYIVGDWLVTGDDAVPCPSRKPKPFPYGSW